MSLNINSNSIISSNWVKLLGIKIDSRLNFEPHAGVQLGGGGRWGRLPLHFFENLKKCPDFAKKGPDCVHP